MIFLLFGGGPDARVDKGKVDFGSRSE